LTGLALCGLALILGLAGCGLPQAAPPTPAASPAPASTPSAAPPEPSPSPAPAATHTPSPTPVPGPAPAPLYTISATLDYAAHSLSVLERIDYTNRGAQPLAEILLMADMQTYPPLELGDLKSASGPAPLQIDQQASHIRLPLERPLQPGEAITLEIAYQLRIPARTADPALRPMVFGWSERQTNLVDWYLYIPPYQDGAGWLAHDPGYYGEHQVYEASDFSVNLAVLNAPPNLAVAASAPEQAEGEWRHFELKQARTFAISLSPSMLVTQRSVGGVTITGYAFPEHAAAGEASLNTAAQALALYSQLFGPYPHLALAVVEADFLDGMEYDGLFFLSNGFYNLYTGSQGEYLVALSAHETAHQWWFGLVGSDQALEPWLDEALCTYSERLYYEKLAPQALDWWWQVRVKYYQPRGYVDDSIYNPHREAQAYRAYRDAVYLNGAMFLEELRQLTGDEAFFGFLREYARRYAGRLAGAADFFAVLREHTQADLRDLTQKYFSAPQ